MKLNYVGIVGGIVAFVSVALPWWSWSYSGLSGDVKLFDRGILNLNLWYGWVALLFVLLGGLLGLAGSVMPKGKKILLGGGILAVIAIILFPIGFQMDLTRLDAPFGIFSSGTYPTYGFWLELLAAIIMLLALLYPQPIEQAPSPPPQTTEAQKLETSFDL